MDDRKTLDYMKETLDEIVKEMLKEHTGGEKLNSLLNLVGDTSNKNIVVSGRFGKFFKAYSQQRLHFY